LLATRGARLQSHDPDEHRGVQKSKQVSGFASYQKFGSEHPGLNRSVVKLNSENADETGPEMRPEHRVRTETQTQSK
jgi:hypothetical protein